MIRLIGKEMDLAAMAFGGSNDVDVSYKTFDVEAVDVEHWLNEQPQYGTRRIVAAENCQARCEAPPKEARDD